MKYKISYTSRFKKDYKRIVKSGLDISKLKWIIEMLANDKALPEKYKDHKLISDKDYDEVRECHIAPDWLLIYKIDNNELILWLIRTGSHSNLF